MSSKENVAINQLLALLETRYALRVLWALRDGHPQTFRLLQDSVGGITPNTLNTRLKALREANLIGHGDKGYNPDLRGRRPAQAPGRSAGLRHQMDRRTVQEEVSRRLSA